MRAAPTANGADGFSTLFSDRGAFRGGPFWGGPTVGGPLPRPAAAPGGGLDGGLLPGGLRLGGPRPGGLLLGGPRLGGLLPGGPRPDGFIEGAETTLALSTPRFFLCPTLPNTIPPSSSESESKLAP